MFKKLVVNSLMVGLALAASTLAAHATCSSYPYTLMNGTTADATQVMADLNCAALTSGSTLDSTSFTNVSTFQEYLNLKFGVTNSGYLGRGSGLFSGFSASDLGIRAVGNLLFGSNNNSSAPYMTIGTSGTVGIGAAPQVGVSLSIGPNTSSHGVLAVSNTTGYYGVIGRATASGAFSGLFDSNGASGSCSLQYGATSWACSSDVRLKTNIANISGTIALAKLSALSGVTFNWKTNSKTNEQMGVIAQEVQKVFPDAVSSDPKGYLAVQYDSLIAPLISAVNALNYRTSDNRSPDARLTKNMAPLTSGLALVTRLHPASFEWRTAKERVVGKDLDLPTGEQIGFSDQDVVRILPSVAVTDKGNAVVINLTGTRLVPVLVAAMKELKATNDKQAARIERLEESVATLQHKLAVQTASR